MNVRGMELIPLAAIPLTNSEILPPIHVRMLDVFAFHEPARRSPDRQGVRPTVQPTERVLGVPAEVHGPIARPQLEVVAFHKPRCPLTQSLFPGGGAGVRKDWRWGASLREAPWSGAIKAGAERPSHLQHPGHGLEFHLHWGDASSR